jgi:hypothetical protein
MVLAIWRVEHSYNWTKKAKNNITISHFLLIKGFKVIPNLRKDAEYLLEHICHLKHVCVTKFTKVT